MPLENSSYPRDALASAGADRSINLIACGAATPTERNDGSACHV